jgi:hypothetical protein
MAGQAVGLSDEYIDPHPRSCPPSLCRDGSSFSSSTDADVKIDDTSSNEDAVRATDALIRETRHPLVRSRSSSSAGTSSSLGELSREPSKDVVHAPPKTQLKVTRISSLTESPVADGSVAATFAGVISGANHPFEAAVAKLGRVFKKPSLAAIRAFQKVPHEELQTSPNNPHAENAKIRTACDLTMKGVASALQKTGWGRTHVLFASKREMMVHGPDAQYVNRHFTEADLRRKAISQKAPIEKGDIIILSDVYHGYKEVFDDNPECAIIMKLQRVASVAGLLPGDEGWFTMGRDGLVKTQVATGVTYSHPIMHSRADLAYHHREQEWFVFENGKRKVHRGPRRTLYQVVNYDYPGHSVVCFHPVATMKISRALWDLTRAAMPQSANVAVNVPEVTSLFVKPRVITRPNVAGALLCAEVHKEHGKDVGIYMSMVYEDASGRIDPTSEFSLRLCDYQTLELATVGSGNASVGCITRLLAPKVVSKLTMQQKVLASKYFNGKDHQIIIQDAVGALRMSDSDGARTHATVTLPPLVEVAHCPPVGSTSDAISSVIDRSLQPAVDALKRVEEVDSEDREKIDGYIGEFTSYLRDELLPAVEADARDYNEVLVMLSKTPAQKRNYKDFDETDRVRAEASTFNKIDFGKEHSALRIITAVDQRHVIGAAGILNIVYRHAPKAFPWWMGGRSHEEKAGAISAMMLLTDGPMEESDIVKFDASTLPAVRDPIMGVFAELAASLEPKLNEDAVAAIAVDANLHSQLYTLDGPVTADTNGAVGSGSNTTTALGSCGNAMCAYIAQRMNGVSHADAITRFVVQGDDGVNVFSPWSERVYKRFGYLIEIQARDHGTPVNFCGRYVWPSGDEPFEIADPVRCLSRLPVVIKPGDPLALTKHRLTGYLTLAFNTPVVREYVEACLRVVDFSMASKKPLSLDADDRYQTQMASLCRKRDYHYGEREEKLAVVADLLGLLPHEAEALCIELKCANSVDEIRALRFRPARVHNALDTESGKTAYSDKDAIADLFGTSCQEQTDVARKLVKQANKAVGRAVNQNREGSCNDANLALATNCIEAAKTLVNPKTQEGADVTSAEAVVVATAKQLKRTGGEHRDISKRIEEICKILPAEMVAEIKAANANLPAELAYLLRQQKRDEIAKRTASAGGARATTARSNAGGARAASAAQGGPQKTTGSRK